MKYRQRSRLTSAYKSFFKALPGIAVSPYVKTYHIAGRMYGRACILLSAIPVLPALTVITMACALIAAVLALLSTVFTYPGAEIADAMDCCNRSEEKGMGMA